MTEFPNPISSLAGSPDSSAGCCACRTVRFYRPKVGRFSLICTERPARKQAELIHTEGSRALVNCQRRPIRCLLCHTHNNNLLSFLKTSSPLRARVSLLLRSTSAAQTLPAKLDKMLTKTLFASSGIPLCYAFPYICIADHWRKSAIPAHLIV
jgi:hypothetical protein